MTQVLTNAVPHKRSPKRHLEAPRTVEAVESCAPPSAKRAQCGSCSKVINGGAVVVDGEWIEDLAEHSQLMSHLIERANEKAAGQSYGMRCLYCDFCDHVQIWPEVQDFTGNFTGVVLTDPVLIRGRHRDRFLNRHPEAAGVQQT